MRHDRDQLIEAAKQKRQDGLSYAKIGRDLGIGTSTIQAWLNPDRTRAYNKATRTKYRAERKARAVLRYQNDRSDLTFRCKQALWGIRRRARDEGHAACMATAEELQAAYIEQDGFCKICQCSEGKYGQRLHVDHCHKTGRFRGWLCHTCNKRVGFIEVSDDPQSLVAAILAYLST